ncbi:lysine-rich nucleolar protein 1 isoform X4 [Grammomys surdaster]|uniref:lysine-rich nucleolar protein 1 isoform X4 n=1 Tax=Grammomys surdaster TaxID=491861 RepID=UPI00109EF255|nr:lysine-rich nucleolar protein 1 isoform X4 [Grammomys surdaster]
MDAVSTATQGALRLRPGRRKISRGRARNSKLTSGSRRRGCSRGDAWPASRPVMVSKTQKADLGPRLSEKKKKKKKKKRVVTNVSEPETQYSVLNSNDYFIDVSPPRATSPSINVGEVQVPEMSLGKRKKKKKSCSTYLEEYLGTEPTQARQKKSPSPRRQVLEQSAEGLIREKKKKRRKSLSKAASQGSGLKTSPDPKHAKEESDTDLEVVLEKKGNMDETCIDQVRRKALQEEIDRESGKTEASEPKKWTGTQFGQWDTAGFEDEEQKLKFLKLMGGFKHLSPSFSRPPSMTVRSNMALDRKSSEMLQQSLQQDYDRAMSWKYSHGAGLGFNSEARKVFYIDRNASKSIKLQD